MSAVPFSYRQYAGNGSTTSFSVPFPYLLKSHVKVYIGFNILDGTYSSELADGTGFTWSSGTQIQCTTAPASGQTLTVIRVTPNTTRLVDWQDGSNLISNDLDTADLQNLYVIQEQQDRNDAGITQSTAAQVAAAAATTASTTATTTANTALSTANTALSTANTASSNASAAVSTANTASTNASAAVATANTASTNASAAVSTANTASSNASSAVATANSAVSTANSAATAASSAVTTANNANTTAQAANTTATNAESIANSALSIVAGTVQFVPVANVAAVPGSPSNDDAIQVQDSTGIESFSPLTGLPAGFTGTPQLFVRIQYDTPGSTWQYVGYGANDPDNRYVIQGVLGTANNPSFYFDPDTGIYSPGADELGLSTGGAARLTIDSAGNVAIPGTLGVTGAITGSLTGAASLNVLKTGDTMTGSLTATALIPSGSTVPTNGVYLPAANSVAISTNSTGRVFINSTGLGVGASPSSAIEVASDGTPQLKVGMSSNAARASLMHNGSDLYLDTSAGALVFRGASFAERMRLDSSGRLGIGTSSPQAVLESKTANVQPGDAAYAKKSVVANIPYSTSNVTSSVLAVYDGTVHAADIGYSYDGTGYYLTLGTNDDTVGSPTERLRVDRQGRVGIGTTSVNFGAIDHGVHIYGSGAQEGIRLETTNGSGGILEIYAESGGNTLDTRGSGYIRFNNAATEWGRWDSSGRLLVGTSSTFSSGDFKAFFAGDSNSNNGGVIIGRFQNTAGGVPALELIKSRGASVGTNTVVQSGDELGTIRFKGADGTNYINAAEIRCDSDGTPGANDMPGRLVFSTTADGASSPTPRMTITSAGALRFGQITTDFPGSGNTTAGVALTAGGRSGFSQDSDFPLLVNRNTSDGTIVQINRQGSGVGSISVTTTATAYNTSSDYRLKENVTPVSDGITRLQQLKPSRFNFIADPDKTVDGFIAHEAQAVVPECVTGVKDAVDADGNPIYQGIDQSKLVPLLTAALQEAVAKIESLEARLTSAGL